MKIRRNVTNEATQGRSHEIRVHTVPFLSIHYSLVTRNYTNGRVLPLSGDTYPIKICIFCIGIGKHTARVHEYDSLSLVPI